MGNGILFQQIVKKSQMTGTQKGTLIMNCGIVASSKTLLFYLTYILSSSQKPNSAIDFLKKINCTLGHSHIQNYNENKIKIIHV